MQHHLQRIRRNVAIANSVRQASTMEVALDSLLIASASEKRRRRKVRTAKSLEEALDHMMNSNNSEGEQAHHTEQSHDESKARHACQAQKVEGRNRS